jgi:hypothetical protein
VVIPFLKKSKKAMQWTRVLVILKIVFLAWPVVWSVLFVSPGWIGTFSQLTLLLICALSAGVSMAQRWTINAQDEGLQWFDLVMATLSGISAAVLSVYLTASILLRCDSVMTTSGDPVFAVACLDEESLMWALALTSILVTILDAIYVGALYYQSRKRKRFL